MKRIIKTEIELYRFIFPIFVVTNPVSGEHYRITLQRLLATVLGSRIFHSRIFRRRPPLPPRPIPSRLIIDWPGPVAQGG